MALQSLSEERRQFEDFFNARKLATVEDQEDECVTAQLDYVDQTCVFSEVVNYDDVTSPAIALGSLCTAIVRSPGSGKLVAGYYLDYAESTKLYGDDEVNAGRFELQITSKCVDDDKLRLLDELFQIYKECSDENWDGYDAEPITQKTLLEAEKFIELLPSSLNVPEIIPEPTGEIAFEWYRGKRFVFIASVGGNNFNLITYAGLFGKTSKIHGTEYLGDKFPTNVIGNIHRLFEGHIRFG